MRFIEKYSRKVLKRKVSEVNRQVKIKPLDQVRKVGILWRQDDIKAFSYLQEFFRIRATIIRNLCFAVELNFQDSNVITKKDLSWLGFPRGGTVETFIASDFDLLINVNTADCYPLDVITALSAASFKIGWDQRHEGLFDMSVDVSKQPDSFYLAEQMMLYLKKFAR